jgi:hypothetical protein
MAQSLLAPEFCLELHQFLRCWIHGRKSEVVSKTQCQISKMFDIVCWNNRLEFRYRYTIYKEHLSVADLERRRYQANLIEASRWPAARNWKAWLGFLFWTAATTTDTKIVHKNFILQLLRYD